MAAIPYARPAYDNSAYSARMSDLIRTRGAVQANAVRQQGAANAYLWGNLIDTAGQTMSDLIKYQAGEPERKLREAQTARLTREERKAFEADEIDRQTAGMSTEDAATIAEGYGHPEKAQQIRERAMTIETKRLQLEELKGKRIADEFTKAGDVIRLAMTQEVPPERRQQAWSEGRARLAKALDLTPEDMAAIPESVPTDPNVLNRYLEMTMTARERADAARAAAVALKDSRKDDADYTQYLATHVAAAGDEREFNSIRDMAIARGKGELFSSLFGQTYTPEAVAYAQRSLTVGKGEAGKPKAGDLADLIAQEEARLKRPLTVDEKLRLKARDAAAGRAPEKGVSQAQVGTAEREKAAALRRVETQWRKDYENEYIPGQNMPSEAALADLEQRKLEVENSFRRQTGSEPVENVAEAGYRPAVKEADKWRIAADAQLEKDFQAANPGMKDGKAPTPKSLEALQKGKADVAAEYRRRLAQEIRSGSSNMAALAVPGAGATPPAAPAPTAAAAPAVPPRQGPPMTQGRASEILSAKLGRTPLPEEIQKFMAKYPYEVIR